MVYKVKNNIFLYFWLSSFLAPLFSVERAGLVFLLVAWYWYYLKHFIKFKFLLFNYFINQTRNVNSYTYCLQYLWYHYLTLKGVKVVSSAWLAFSQWWRSLRVQDTRWFELFSWAFGLSCSQLKKKLGMSWHERYNNVS